MQVLIDEAEWKQIRAAARAKGLTLAEWVRQALRRGLREEAAVPPDRKLAVVRAAARHAFPTADIDDMLAEIERGYTGRT